MTRLIVAAYIAAITTANLLVAEYGPSITVVNAFLLIGFDLAARDHLHDAWQKHRHAKMAALIGTAGAISYAANPAAGRIAAASVAAFVLAATADYAVYHAARRWKWEQRTTVSNIAGAAVDSIAFPALAFGFPLLWIVAAGQFAAKVGGGAVWTLLIGLVRKPRTLTIDEHVGVLAATYAQMGGRVAPTAEDVTRARESYAAHRIAAARLEEQ
jgi:uncharacterized PurR-regulated membrane protein YhhQ (DUF165 family)